MKINESAESGGPAEAVNLRQNREAQGGAVGGFDGLSARLSGSSDPVYLKAVRIIRMPRMTVRFLFVAVALAAVATEVGLAGWRVVVYRIRADYHARKADDFYAPHELSGWHEHMSRKYDSGAFNPWVSVEPEPPPK